VTKRRRCTHCGRYRHRATADAGAKLQQQSSGCGEHHCVTYTARVAMGSVRFNRHSVHTMWD